MKNTKRRFFLPVVVFLSIIGLGYFWGCKTEATLENQTPTAEYESTANSLAGQSFYRLGTSDDWRDMHHEGKGNLRLKAFTKNRAQ